MFVSKSTARILCSLVPLVGFAQEVLWVNYPLPFAVLASVQTPFAVLASVHIPILPEAAFAYRRDVVAMRRKARAINKASDMSFLAEPATKEDFEFNGTSLDEDEADEDSDESSTRVKEKPVQKREVEGEEEEEESSRGQTGTKERTAGLESAITEKESKGHENEEEKPIAGDDDVYTSTKLPEPSVGVADAQEACDSMHCAQVVAGASPKAKLTGCARTVKCAQCRSKLDPEERCTTWKPPSRSSITLATGWTVSKVKLMPGSALNLPIKWDTQDAFEDAKCLPDTKQVQYAYDKLNRTGNVDRFPFTRVLSVQMAIYSTPLEGARKPTRTPQMIYYIEVTDPYPWSAVKEEEKSPQTDPRCHQSLQTLPAVQLRGRSAVFGLGWFSVLKEKSHTISPANVGVRVECTGKKSCNLKNYVVCLRVTCPPTAASAERQMAAAFAAMKAPVGENPKVTELGTPDSAGGGKEDPDAAVPADFSAWIYAQQSQLGYGWESGEARTATVFSLALACLALHSAALNFE